MRKFLCVLLLSVNGIYAQQSASSKSLTDQNFANNLAQQKTGIIENKGQVCDQNRQPRADVLYYGITGSLSYYLKNNGVSYQLCNTNYIEDKNIELTAPKLKGLNTIAVSDIYRIDVNWLGANTNAIASLTGAHNESKNYYLPQCPNGVTGVKNYSAVTYNNIYNNVDLKYYYNADNALEYDFIVNPGGDYTQIALEINGATAIIPSNDGGVSISTPLGVISQGKPNVSQNGKAIAAEWIVNGNILSYQIDNYDKSQPVTIDPVILTWGTYFGNGNELGTAVSTDLDGNVILSGASRSTTGVATTGAYLTTYADSGDAFVAKFNSLGMLQWSTYYGGISLDQSSSCATDRSNNIYIVGITFSATGLATAGAHQTSCDACTPHINSNCDGFVAKFNATGVLLWGTYYGGPEQDMLYSCASDSIGDLYITGITGSPTGIATPGAYQTSGSALLAKFDSTGNLVWGTYYGSYGTFPYSCAVDNDNNIYFTGVTWDTSGIASPGAYRSSLSASQAAYLVKFSPTGSRMWATYFGDTGYSKSDGCATDRSGNVYIAGNTTSPTGIATVGSYTSACSCDSISYSFLAKFNSSGSLVWGTYIGSDSTVQITGCASDPLGNVCITGETNSNLGIATPDGYQVTCDSCYISGSYNNTDAFITMFSSSGRPLWGTYYGGSHQEMSGGCTMDASGNVYMTGWTLSTHNIATTGAFLTTCDSCAIPGNPDAYLAKFNYTTTGINAVKNGDEDYTLYPNPTHNIIYVKGITPALLKVLNTYGQTVVSAEHTDHISLSNLPGGVYFVQLLDENGIVLKREKVVKW